MTLIDLTMDPLTVGNTHPHTLSSYPRGDQVPHHGNRLLHQVDISRGVGKHHNNKYFEILQQEHPSTIRDSQAIIMDNDT